MSRVETVKVQNPDGKGFFIMNKADFDADQSSKGKSKWKLYDDSGDEPEANSLDNPAMKNTSGTFDEPTPTDVRYPNKDTTEFENNHGAFVGASAAEMRDAEGMEQAPGGLAPEVHEAVQDAEEEMKAAIAKAAAPTKLKGGKRSIARKSLDDEEETAESKGKTKKVKAAEGGVDDTK